MRKVLVASLCCPIELLKISSAFFSAQALLACGDLSRKKHYSNWMTGLRSMGSCKRTKMKSVIRILPVLGLETACSCSFALTSDHFLI